MTDELRPLPGSGAIRGLSGELTSEERDDDQRQQALLRRGL